MSKSKRNDKSMCKTAEFEEQCRQRRLRRVARVKHLRRVAQVIEYEPARPAGQTPKE